MVESMTKLATEVPGSLGSPQFPRGFRTFLIRFLHSLGAWNRLNESLKNQRQYIASHFFFSLCSSLFFSHVLPRSLSQPVDEGSIHMEFKDAGATQCVYST